MSKKGPVYMARYYLLRMSEKYHEMRYGIETEGLLKPEQLGIDCADSHDYVPIPYRVIQRVMRKLNVSAGSGDVLLDMGCGMGRPMAAASRYPFERILGVEISPELCEVARRNMDRCRPRARCPKIEVVNADASSYRLPDDVTVIFMYNPFRGETLRRVIENMRQSLVRRRRRLRIVYGNRVFFEQETSGMPWIEREYRVSFFPNGSWALYHADPELVGAEAANAERSQKNFSSTQVQQSKP